MSNKKIKENREKILTVFLIIVSVILLFSVISDVQKNIIKRLFNGRLISSFIASPEDKKKNALKETYDQIIEYEKNYDYSALYSYLTYAGKSLKTMDEYVQFRRNGSAGIYNIEFLVNDIAIHGDDGIIDSTLSYCRTINCLDTERASYRSKKQYFYIGEKWYHNIDDRVYCGRFEKYPIPEEFDRAVGLIIQRFEQSIRTFGNQSAENVANIRNCLDIQYARSDDEMRGAEGLFMFSENSGSDRLQIFVSPRYQVKDDLLTAILLSHEISHAFLFATGLNRDTSCYENEATAFASQISFMSTLNMEELSSITYRYNNRSSQEVVSAVNLITTLTDLPGADWYQKALSYVKNNTFYQNQCDK